MSSKVLEEQLNEIRKNLIPSLGKSHGRVVLKSVKPHLNRRLEEFREKLDAFKTNVQKDRSDHKRSSWK